VPPRPKRPAAHPMWINHFALLPGDPSVKTSFNAINSGVGGGLAALVVQSTTTGENAAGGGNKVVHMALQVPPGYLVVGVRLCYESTNARSFISQVRIAQVGNPPGSATVLLDDATDHVDVGPVCVDVRSPQIDPAKGPLLFSLRVKFGRTSDKIAVRGLALRLVAKP
jgi:hypothetical protein